MTWFYKAVDHDLVGRSNQKTILKHMIHVNLTSLPPLMIFELIMKLTMEKNEKNVYR